MSNTLHLLLATVLTVFIGGKYNLPIAAWIMPIFALRFFRNVDKAGRNFLLLWVASAAATIFAWSKATATAAIHPMAEPIFFFLMTPIGLLPYVLDRLYYRRFGNTALVALVYPIAFTAVDFFSASGSPFGTFGAAAYSQRGLPAIMQIASVTGLWGITFVMSLFATLVNHFWDKKPTRLSWTLAGSLALILCLSLGSSLLPAPAEQTATVAGFSLPNGKLPELLNQLNGGDEAGFRQNVDDLHTRQLNQIRSLADDGANIVVLQEGAGMGMSDQVEQFVADASAIAQEKNIYIVLPTFDFGAVPPVNSVRIIDPNGDVVLNHIKYGGSQFEGSQPGDRTLQTVDTPYGKLSAVICWDADFPVVMKQAGEQNVDLLFIPANDWLELRDIHSGMSTFRAVENGLSIFRQTGQGVSLAADAHGNLLNRVDAYAEPASDFAGIQQVEMTYGSVDTAYESLGDWLGNVTLLGLVGLLIGLFVTRKMKANA